MSDLRFNTISGAVLGSLLLVVGLRIGGEEVFAPHFPEKPAYEIDITSIVAPAGGGAAAVEAGPVDWGVVLADPAAVAAGQKALSKCVSCHTFEKGGPILTGPNQYNLINSPSGADAGFTGYSEAMKSLNQTWTYDNLDKFLAAPATVVRGTTMAFIGVKRADERHALIAYLRTLSDSPAAIPAPLPPKAEAPAAPPAGEAPAAPSSAPAPN